MYGRLIGAVALAALVAALTLSFLGQWESVELRSTEPLAVAMQEIAELHAASARYSVLVEQESSNVALPWWLSGDRTSLFAVGDVSAVVDLRQPKFELDDRVVTVTLPAVRLTPAVINAAESKVVNNDRGIAQRLAVVFGTDRPPDNTALMVEAAQRLNAAAAQGDLRTVGETSTRETVARIATSLGFESRVIFLPAD